MAVWPCQFFFHAWAFMHAHEYVRECVCVYVCVSVCASMHMDVMNF